jgi:acyl-CoA thioesterase FadM
MAFRSQLIIRFGDIDRAGIVYYPRFLHYFHVALEEFFIHRHLTTRSSGRFESAWQPVSVTRTVCPKHMA